jgi:hypothetical protein
MNRLKDRFTKDAAAKTGKSEQSIRRAATRAKALGLIWTGSSERRWTKVPSWPRCQRRRDRPGNPDRGPSGDTSEAIVRGLSHSRG